MRSELVSSMPLWLLHLFLPPVPVLTSLSERPESINQINFPLSMEVPICLAQGVALLEGVAFSSRRGLVGGGVSLWTWALTSSF